MIEFFLEWLSYKFGDSFVIIGTIGIVILAAKVVKRRLESSDEESSASNKSQEDGSENDE